LISWALSARNDLAEILTYFLSIEEEETGRMIVRLLIKSARRLNTFPLSGKPGHIPGTREIIPPKLPYMLIYQLGEDNKHVEILNVIHTSRLWPEDSI